MKRTFLISIFIFLAFGMAWAQETDFRVPDSLIAKLKEFRGTDLTRIKALDACIMFCHGKHHITEAEPYINELEQLTANLKDSYWIALTKYYKGICDFENYDYPSALSNLNESLRLAETFHETEQIQLLLSRIYLARSGYYAHFNMFPECYENIENGLNAAKNYDFVAIENSLLSNKGVLLMKMNKFDDAIKYFKELYKKNSDNDLLKFIATSYSQLKEFDSTNYYANLSIVKASTNKDTVEAYNTIGINYLNQGKFQESEWWFNKSLAILEKSFDKSLAGNTFLCLSYCSDGNDDYDRAIKYADSVIKIADETEDIELKWLAMKHRINVLENMHDFEGEIRSMREFMALSDTINERTNIEKLTTLQNRHEAEAREQQYASEQALLGQKQNFIIIISSIIVVFAILFAVMVWANKKRKERYLQAELDSLNREITSKAMEQMQVNKVLNEAVTTLTHHVNNPQNNDINTTIRQLECMIDDSSHKDFDYYFVQVHPDFYNKLLADFPNLTQNELRLCAFIKANLNVKDVAKLNGVSVDSVKTARSRLRKKLGIENPNASLVQFFSKY